MIAECCENLFLYNSKTEISMNNNMTFIALQFFPTKGSAGSAKSQYNSPKWKAAGDRYKRSFSSRVPQSSWWPWIPGTPLRSPVWHPHVLPGAGAQCCLADNHHSHRSTRHGFSRNQQVLAADLRSLIRCDMRWCSWVWMSLLLNVLAGTQN